VQSDAPLNMGVTLTLHVRSARQSPATDADEAPGPPSHSSASACLNDRVRESAKWLQTAFGGGRGLVRLHLSHLTSEAGQEDAALTHLKEHLSLVVQGGRDTCAGCENQHVLYVVIVILDMEQIVEQRCPSHSVPPHLYIHVPGDTRSDTGARHVKSPHGRKMRRVHKQSTNQGVLTDRQTDTTTQTRSERERPRARVHTRWTTPRNVRESNRFITRLTTHQIVDCH
jgi:hypothetical protein